MGFEFGQGLRLTPADNHTDTAGSLILRRGWGVLGNVLLALLQVVLQWFWAKALEDPKPQLLSSGERPPPKASKALQR